LRFVKERGLSLTWAALLRSRRLHLGWLFPRDAGALGGMREGQLSHAFLQALVTNIASVPMASGQKNQKNMLGPTYQ
jgi:hypothetical protein